MIAPAPSPRRRQPTAADGKADRGSLAGRLRSLGAASWRRSSRSSGRWVACGSAGRGAPAADPRAARSSSDPGSATTRLVGRAARRGQPRRTTRATATPRSGRCSMASRRDVAFEPAPWRPTATPTSGSPTRPWTDCSSRMTSPGCRTTSSCSCRASCVTAAPMRDRVLPPRPLSRRRDVPHPAPARGAAARPPWRRHRPASRPTSTSVPSGGRCWPVLGIESRMDRLEVGGRPVVLAARPIGIEPDANGSASSQRMRRVGARVRDLRARHAGRHLVIAVDRLDYTKGIPERLRALRHLSARDPSGAAGSRSSRSRSRHASGRPPVRGAPARGQRARRRDQRGARHGRLDAGDLPPPVRLRGPRSPRSTPRRTSPGSARCATA